METKTDRNLIIFFSWGRLDLVEKAFASLLENKRPQDRLMVIDQEMRNFDYYAKHRDKIDYLTFFRLNYDIGPIWMYVQHFVNWQKSLSETYTNLAKGQDKYYTKMWSPDYVNIVESDAVGKKGWIDRIVKVFDSTHNIGIASGYDDKDEGDYKTKAMNGKVKIKAGVQGVQVMFKAEQFVELFDWLHARSQDDHASKLNKNQGRLCGVLPDEIEHIGSDRKSSDNMEEINV